MTENIEWNTYEGGMDMVYVVLEYESIVYASESLSKVTRFLEKEGMVFDPSFECYTAEDGGSKYYHVYQCHEETSVNVYIDLDSMKIIEIK